METQNTITSLQWAYAKWNYYPTLKDWAREERMTVRDLQHYYPLKVFAVYEIHKALRNLTKIPNKCYKAFRNKDDAFVYAGLEPNKFYVKNPIIEVPYYREADVLKKTFTKFINYPAGAMVDVPLPNSYFTAHYFHNYCYYIYCPTTDKTYEQKEFYKNLYKEFLNIKIISWS